MSTLPKRIAALAAISALLFSLTNCGGKGALTGPAPSNPAPAQPTGSSSLRGSAAQLAARDMNVLAGQRGYAVVSVQGQQPVDPALRLASSLASPAGFPELGLPSALPVDGRFASVWSPDNLILDGSTADPSLPQQNTLILSAEAAAQLVPNTDPLAPNGLQGAWASYRFVLEDYANSGEPQSIGTLWAENGIPPYYFVGLANWQANQWDWFEGEEDQVVTLDSLAPYIRSLDSNLVVVVLALDDLPHDLALVQIGAKEIRAFGALPQGRPLPQEITVPPLYDPDKQGSAVLPAVYEPDDALYGPVRDQGSAPSCTAHAAAAAQTFELRREFDMLWDPANNRKHWISPYWTFYETAGELNSCYDGRDLSTVLEFIKNTGVVTRLNDPKSVHCSRQYDRDVCTIRARMLRLDGWAPVNCKGAAGIKEIKRTLYELGHPVLIAITLDDNFDSVVNNGITGWTWSDDVPDYDQSHAMVITGWDNGKGGFRVRNSWGKDWGQGGSCYIDYATFSTDAWIECFTIWDSYSQGAANAYGATPEGAAIPVENLAATIGSPDHVQLTWDSVPNATGYGVFRDSQTNLIANVDAPSTTYTDTSLTDFDAHTYWIETRVGGAPSKTKAEIRGWRYNPGPPVIESVKDIRFWTKRCVEGDLVPFSSTVTNPSGLPLTYTWSFPAGALAAGHPPVTGWNPTVTLGSAGTYTCNLTVSNIAGQSSMDFPLVIEQQLPLAIINGPAVIKRNKILYLDGAGSTAPAGASIVKYFWDKNNDGVVDETLAGSSQYGLILSQLGDQVIGLKVEDSRGLQSNWGYLTVKVIPYDEIEPNDDPTQAPTWNMGAKVIYKGSIGLHTSCYDGSDTDWWRTRLPAYAEAYSRNVYLRFDPAQFPDGLDFRIESFDVDGNSWGYTYTTVTDGETNLIWQIYEDDPPNLHLKVKVQVPVGSTAGGDYSLEVVDVKPF